MKLPTTSIMLFLSLQTLLYSQTVNVTSPGDNGIGSLRQAITDVNEGGDASNTIHLQVPGNSPIMVNSDLPVIKKNTDIVSTGQQTINGGGQHRLFATIMADLTLTNCNLDKGAAIGGNVALNNFGGNIATSNFGSGGGGLGAGGGIYIDRGQTLILQATTISQCKAQGGKGGFSGLMRNRGGGGASFSIRNRNVTYDSGGGVEVGGDFPGSSESGGASDGSSFLTGYGGGPGGGNGGSGGGDRTGEGSVQGGGKGGYCGGGGGQLDTTNGGGGNGGGNPGGGGFGSGGYGAGGGGFGGGGGSIGYSQKGFGGGGGFGAGGGGGDENEMNQGKGGSLCGQCKRKARRRRSRHRWSYFCRRYRHLYH